MPEKEVSELKDVETKAGCSIRERSWGVKHSFGYEVMPLVEASRERRGEEWRQSGRKKEKEKEGRERRRETGKKGRGEVV